MEDKDILALIKKEESRQYGFQRLVRKYQKQVYYHIRRMVVSHEDADDLTQETFVKVWQNIDNFREDAKLYTWIYRIATNEALRFLDKKKRRWGLPLVNVEEQLEKLLDKGTYISADEISLKLQKAMLRLPEKQRLVFQMKYFDDMKYDEIAEVLGTTVGNLKAAYHWAVKKIEAYLMQD